ncbi:hypothetical protein YPPY92_1907, partial [Yersinia pestis PY-92]
MSPHRHKILTNRPPRQHQRQTHRIF